MSNEKTETSGMSVSELVANSLSKVAEFQDLVRGLLKIIEGQAREIADMRKTMASTITAVMDDGK